jgi:hypothetical protein
LKYAKWTGGTWNIETVDPTGRAGEGTSIALDSNNYPHISYYDDTNDNLKYAKWTGSIWGIQIVDSSGGGIRGETSIALDSNDYPHISYYDAYNNWDLKYAKWTGSIWSLQTVDSTGNVGRYTSLALDTSNKPHISYYDYTNGDLKYAYYISDIVTAPEIISHAPESPVNDYVGATRTFSITINQTVDVNWQINGTEVQTNASVTAASYTNTSAVNGTWNVSAIVSNANGTDMQTWTWTVTSPCFIATAAYGTALHEDIDVLRDFRDEYLMPNPAGRAFVNMYYSSSPPLADLIRCNEGLRTAVRAGFVKPVVHITRRFVG